MDVEGEDLFCFSTFLDITEKEKMALTKCLGRIFHYRSYLMTYTSLGKKIINKYSGVNNVR